MSEEPKPIKTERIDNPDGTYTVKSYFDNNKDYLSEIELFNTNDELLECMWFCDDSFNEILCKQINNLNDKTTIILRYKDEINNYKCEKRFYNEEDLVNKVEYYVDYELKELYATEIYEYLPLHIEMKTIFEYKHKGYYSCIEYSKINGQVYKTISFCDKNFSNIYRKSLIKYTKNNDTIILRIYSKKELNNYYAEIEKYNSDKNIIYQKQYKFKGILAHILFWLAR